MNGILIPCALITCVFQGNVVVANVQSTLEMIHVIFRHGDRTPASLYPKDPYTEESFYPIRIGHLTNKGKMTAFKVGTSLRTRYKSFIPNVYTPEIIQSVSSHYPRTKASLELVLAGLFPPTEELNWNNELAWQAIPYDYLPQSKNKVFLPSSACPNYSIVAEKSKKLYHDPVEDKYRKLLPYLQESSGIKNDSVLYVGMELYSSLKAEDELGLKLPEWTKNYYPGIINELSAHYWLQQSAGDLKALRVGFLISRILNNTRYTLNNDPAYKDTKIYLYSGHDSNIAAMLCFLDNFVPHNPNYGAHIIVEVHNVLGVRYLKFFYENYEYGEPQILNIPFCGINCPLKMFMDLYAGELDPTYLDALCG